MNAAPPPPRPGNDNFLNAYTLSLGSTSGTTINATNDGVASCGASNDSPDVWYRVYIAYDGLLDIDTCGSSLDTVVSLWLNSPFVINPELVCNDDGGLSCHIRASHVQRTVVGGSTTWVRVAGFNNTTGTFVLNVHFTAANNLCGSAVPVTTGTYYGYTPGSGTSRRSAVAAFRAPRPTSGTPTPPRAPAASTSTPSARALTPC